jgi:hypothetical protein
MRAGTLSVVLGTGLLALAASASGVAATLSAQVDPNPVNAGDPVTLTVTVTGGTLGKVVLPTVDGLQVTETESTRTFSYSNGVLTTSTTERFHLVAKQAGNFTIPAFDVPLQEGGALHTQELKLQVMDNTVAPATNAAPSTAAVPAGPTNLVVAPAGPVILPPVNPTAAAGQPAPNGDDSNGSVLTVPRDKDGGPARVFMLITPETTEAYVGQAVPVRIDFFIRMEVYADQNSLPTIKGSDFLLTNVSERSRENLIVIENEQYQCDTWQTAVTAPKSGDFPLATERDTYWVKSITSNASDPFGFSRHADLAHEVITSNQFTMHVHPLPDEGRPEHFTGAIGQFQVQGDAQPATVAMGEPVTLYYSIAGAGNFDYVRCPALADDADWKTYPPTSNVSFKDEARTHAIKTFEQSVLPRKNGNVPLPAATFSYFDPATKQYVTVPISLPVIAVTGAMSPASAPPAGPGSGALSASPAHAAEELLPNRADLGDLHLDMTPACREPWFWSAQVGILLFSLSGSAVVLIRNRRRVDAGQETARLARRQSLEQAQEAMSQAVAGRDARAFFLAARHAIQLQLGAQWNIQPEAITLGEIRLRDPQLAARVEPLFAQADEVIYSGRASANLDLATWERDVRELLEPQPA